MGNIVGGYVRVWLGKMDWIEMGRTIVDNEITRRRRRILSNNREGRDGRNFYVGSSFLDRSRLFI